MPLPHRQTTPDIFFLFQIPAFDCWEGETFFQCPFLTLDILQSSKKRYREDVHFHSDPSQYVSIDGSS